MNLYLKVCAGILTAVILILTLGSRGKDMGMLLSIGACCMAALAALRYLEPVADLIERLDSLGHLDGNLISILLKAAGIGIISDLSALVCSDAGNASLGKTLQLLGNAVILWLSIPLFTMLTELLQSILGEL